MDNILSFLEDKYRNEMKLKEEEKKLKEEEKQKRKTIKEQEEKIQEEKRNNFITMLKNKPKLIQKLIDLTEEYGDDYNEDYSGDMELEYIVSTRQLFQELKSLN